LSGSGSEDEDSKSDTPVAKSRNESRRAKREAVRVAKRARHCRGEKHAIMVTQMDAHSLRIRGYSVSSLGLGVHILTCAIALGRGGGGGRDCGV